MNQSFFIGAVGASQQMKRMNVQSNNIANVNTYGFRAEKARFSALVYQDMAAIEQEEVPYGVGARMEMTATDFNQSGFADTGRPQDYAIEGHGFFALYDPITGEVSYTRDGAFMISDYVVTSEDEDGEPVSERVLTLTDAEGRFVLNSQGGIITFTDPEEEQDVGVFDFRNYDGMEHVSGTRFLSVDKNGMLMQGDGKVVNGYLEQSNVDLADELTKVIESQRAYTMALRIVQTSDEIETTINNLRK